MKKTFIDEDRPVDVPEPIIEDSAHSFWRSLSKLFVVAVSVLIVVFALHRFPLGDPLEQVQGWKEQLNALGPWGPLTFFGVFMVLVAAGTPRLWMSTLAGALFGFKVGFPIAWVASLCGAYFNFCFVRWGARDAVHRFVRLPTRVQALLYHPGFFAVLLLRQLPMWGVAQNAALAVTKVKHRTYLLGTFCGIMPGTLVTVLIGSGIGKASLEEAVRNLAWAMIALAFFGGLAWYIRRSRLAAAPKA